MDRKTERALRQAALKERMGGFYTAPIRLEALDGTDKFGLAHLVTIAIARINHRAAKILPPGTSVTPVLYLPAPMDQETNLAFLFGTNDNTFLDVGVHAGQEADLAVVGVFDDPDKDLIAKYLRVDLMLSESHKRQIPLHIFPRHSVSQEFAQRDKLFCMTCGENGLVIMCGAVPAIRATIYSRKEAVTVGRSIGDSFELYFACPHCYAIGDATGVQFRNFYGDMVVRDV